MSIQGMNFSPKLASVYLPSKAGDIVAATKDDPHGSYCNSCGRDNDIADRVGWWTAEVQGKHVPVCSHCHPFFHVPNGVRL